MQGSTALLGTEAGTLRMFSLADGSCELALPAHTTHVTALDVCWAVCGAFDGPVAVSGAADGTARAWSLMGEADDPPIAELDGHASTVSALALYGQGARCVGASYDGTALVWDVATGATLPIAC